MYCDPDFWYLRDTKMNYMLDKLISQENIDAVSAIVASGEEFVIVAHKNPDGDAVGSSLGLYHYLASQGKKATVVLPNPFPEFLSWLPATDKVLSYETDPVAASQAVSVADAIFCLDFNSLSRAGDMGALLAASQAKKVLIDHHPQPSSEFDVVISHTVACATAELVFRVVTSLSGVEVLTHDMAQCIYTGMMTDTGAFAYASTRKDIYLIIAHLLDKGIDKDLIYRRVFYNYTLSRMRLFGFVLNEKLKVYNKYNAALITLSHSELMRYYAQKGDTEGLVNQPLQIKGVRFSCFLREEQPGKINVSLRSVDDFPCNAVAAEFFNGGGHLNASGGELHCTLEEAVELYKKAIKKFKNELVG